MEHSPQHCYEIAARALEERAKVAFAAGKDQTGRAFLRAAMELMRMSMGRG